MAQAKLPSTLHMKEDHIASLLHPNLEGKGLRLSGAPKGPWIGEISPYTCHATLNQPTRTANSKISQNNTIKVQFELA